MADKIKGCVLVAWCKMFNVLTTVIDRNSSKPIQCIQWMCSPIADQGSSHLAIIPTKISLNKDWTIGNLIFHCEQIYPSHGPTNNADLIKPLHPQLSRKEGHSSHLPTQEFIKSILMKSWLADSEMRTVGSEEIDGLPDSVLADQGHHILWAPQQKTSLNKAQLMVFWSWAESSIPRA